MVRALRVVILVGMAVAQLAALAQASPLTLIGPTLSEPADGITLDSTPVFRWHAMSGVTSYTFQLSTDPSFPANNMLVNQKTANLVATPSSRLADRDISSPYFWRVGIPDGGTGQAWSALQSFAINWSTGDGPVLKGPEDLAQFVVPRDPIVLSWTSIPGATGSNGAYEVQVSPSDSFASPKTYGTVNTSVAIPPTDLADNTIYSWRVSGVIKSFGTTVTSRSAWSEIRRFQKRWPSQPVPATPADSFTPTTDMPVFSWTPVDGAKDYQLQISPNGDWVNNVTYGGTEGDAASQIWGKTATLGPLQAIEDNQYYWRVRARDAAGQGGAWSSVAKFQEAWPDTPVPLEPADGASVQVPYLRWTPVSNASRYRLQVSSDPAFNPPALCSAPYLDVETDNTSFSPINGIAGGEEGCPLAGAFWLNQRLYWRVRALDERSGIVSTPLPGPWSDFLTAPRSFIITFPPPTPLDPPNGATVTQPRVAWTRVQGAQQYVVTFVKGFITKSYHTDSLTLTSPELGDGVWTWTVVAEMGSGWQSPVLTTNTFTLIAPVNAGTPTITGPASGSTSVLMPEFTWTGLGTKLWFSSDNGATFFNQISIDNSLWTTTTFTTYTPMKLLSSGTYTWCVGASPCESAQQTFTIADLPLAALLGPPSTTTVTATPTLNWSPVQDAAGYYVVMAKDSLFNTIYHDGRTDYHYATHWTTFTPRDSYPDTQAGEGYYWLAIPYKSGNKARRAGSSEFAQAFTFSKQAPAPSLNGPPAEASVSATPVFSWTRVVGAQYYRIVVSTDPLFGSYNVEDNSTDTTTYSPVSKVYPDGTHYWRVQAVDSSGNHLTWSEVRRYVKSSLSPVVIQPAAGVTVGTTPYFSWSAVAGAIKYDLQVSTQSSFGQNTDSATVVGGTAYVSIAKVYPTGTFYWRVRGRDASDNPMSWSNGGSGSSFVVEMPRPNPLSPTGWANPADGLLYRWTVVDGAASYRIEVFGPDGALFETQTGLGNPFWAPTKSYSNSSYRFRVYAKNSANSESPASVELTFTIGTGGTSGLPGKGNVLSIPVALKR